MKSIKSYIILTTFCFSLFLSTSISAANLHAVLVGDTVDASLGYAFEKNLLIMKNEMMRVAEKTDLNLNLVILKNESANRDNVIDQLVNLNVEDDDVVVLYFANHGYRSETQVNPWPSIYFNLSQNGLEFEYANEIILQKSPRFFLSIADSCNSPTIPDGFIDTLKKMDAPLYKQMDVSESNYRKLFLDTSGVIIISSSLPGQYSWAWADQGGVFTLAFGSVMELMSKGEFNADWFDILDETSMRIAMVLTFKGITQTPQYSISVAQ
jgi:hypothetical protein